jgi:hypothetical protein
MAMTPEERKQRRLDKKEKMFKKAEAYREKFMKRREKRHKNI